MEQESLLAPLMHHIHQCRHMLNRGLRQNTVPQIKDVTRTTVHLCQDMTHMTFQLRQWAETARQRCIPSAS